MPSLDRTKLLQAIEGCHNLRSLLLSDQDGENNDLTLDAEQIKNITQSLPHVQRLSVPIRRLRVSPVVFLPDTLTDFTLYDCIGKLPIFLPAPSLTRVTILSNDLLGQEMDLVFAHTASSLKELRLLQSGAASAQLDPNGYEYLPGIFHPMTSLRHLTATGVFTGHYALSPLPATLQSLHLVQPLLSPLQLLEAISKASYLQRVELDWLGDHPERTMSGFSEVTVDAQSFWCS